MQHNALSMLLVVPRAFLPKSWISLLEEKHGKVNAVTMEVNGQIIIKPILEEKEVDG